MQELDLGRAVIDPCQPVTAGAWVTIRYVYTAGHPIDDTGYVKIVFRYAGDFGTPQFDDPRGPNYCRVETSGDCRIEPRWDPKGHTRPWGRSIWLKVMGGFVDRGDQVILTFGERSEGSPGWQMQTFCEKTFEFKTLVDPIATFEFKELACSPTLQIVPGKPYRAVCVAPSAVRVGEPFEYALKLEDEWGNPTAVPQQVACPGFVEKGIHTVMAADRETGLSAESNPIDVQEGPAGLGWAWADLHGQSEETIGTNSIGDYYTFARDYGLLDVSAHQGNDFQVTDDLWVQINQETARFYEPGWFVTFPGYEWSGNTPLGGDRNVYFRSEGGEIVHSSVDLVPGKTSRHPVAATASELFARLASQAGPGAFAVAHVGGRYADLRMHDPDIELAVEVHSAWGTFEWLVEDALRLGYRVGICANSDGHKGRPGASYPGANKFGSYGGLTCIRAQRLDREGIYEALAARHTYATTGNRSLLEVELSTADGRRAMMGDVVSPATGPLRLRVRAVGTAPIESVQVRNGSRVVETLRPSEGGEPSCRVKIVWSGAEVRGRARMATWDGELAVRGNAIREVVPLNFWNAARPPVVQGNQVTWRSITTGGVAGLIVTLDHAREGAISVETTQGSLALAVDEIGAAPARFEFGGLEKRIEVYRLAEAAPRECVFEVVWAELDEGDNPVTVRVTQEDGHMAWSSPIYCVR